MGTSKGSGLKVLRALLVRTEGAATEPRVCIWTDMMAHPVFEWGQLSPPVEESVRELRRLLLLLYHLSQPRFMAPSSLFYHLKFPLSATTSAYINKNKKEYS